MKVDFERKIIEIEYGDTYEKLKDTIELHHLENFSLEPKQYNISSYPQQPQTIPWNPYTYPIYPYPIVTYQNTKYKTREL